LQNNSKRKNDVSGSAIQVISVLFTLFCIHIVKLDEGTASLWGWRLLVNK
jgi:hypothetical protein